MSAISAFPLKWPDGWPRAKNRKSSTYKVSTDAALESLLGALRLMHARNVIVSSNVPLRRDGTMYRGDHSDSRMPDPGVAVYWDGRDAKGGALPRVIACDSWNTVRENVRAIGLTVEALRAIQRSGASELLERAYTGFARLPQSTGPRPWWEVLGIERQASRHAINQRFHELARTGHPDRGGDTARFAEITQAYHQAVGATAGQGGA